MKQLLFLLLFPCLALAQYQGNGNQKITLGEQTSADGLVWRGLAADTTRKPSVDTMAYIILDTATNIQWHYKKAVSNSWLRVGGSISSGLTGVLPVANGGTGTSLLSPNNYLIRINSTGIFDTSVIYEAGGNVGIGLTNAIYKLDILDNALRIGETFENTGRRDINTLKTGEFVTPSYGNGKDIMVFRSVNSTPTNTLNFGGSSSIYDSPTDIVFWTGANTTTTGTEKMRLNSTGNVGIGQTTPTAVLHLKAGTATASTAPLKFTSGTNLTTPEAGAMEFNGTNLLFSPSTTRHTVNHGLTGSATLNFPSTLTMLSADLTITVTGAADGDVVSLGVPNAAVNANTFYSAWVSAANTVTVRFNNYSIGTVDPASALFKVFVTK
jgi:hypothetical protein